MKVISKIISFKTVLQTILFVFLFVAYVSAANFAVDSTLDTVDANVGNDVCADANGRCTLRAAIQEANATSDADTISFNIAGAGVHTIEVNPQLPNSTFPITIDGYTQPGASANTLAIGNDAVLKILVKPSSASNYFGSMITIGSNSTVRGLLIQGSNVNFGSNGLTVSGGNSLVEGNWFGINADGTLPAGQSQFNLVTFGSAGNIIGGTSPAQRNVLANSISAIARFSSPNTTFQNNYVGTLPSGLQSANPGGGGSLIVFSDNNLFGGTAANQRNVISAGGTNDGIQLIGSNNTFQGNYVGVGADGTTPITVGDAGVEIQGNNNLVGGTVGLTPGACTGACNVLFNGTVGVKVFNDKTGNTIAGNSIDNNGTRGILLFGSLSQPLNDNCDADGGNNNGQNFPVITSSSSTALGTNIIGTFNSTPNRTFRLEFFHSPTRDASTYGEGRTYIGSANVTTDANCNAVFNASFAYSAPGSQWVAATATDLTTGDTSEFSVAFRNTAPTAASVFVKGRVLTAQGRGIARAQVSLIAPSGATQTVLTGSFGYFEFGNVEVGGTYVVSVQSKRFQFSHNSRAVYVTEELSDINFIGLTP
jgi:CSLREA domain-containing protein